MAFHGEAGAALVFLILYFAVFLGMLSAYLTHRLKWRSRWSILFFHVTIRVASQACGIGFAILGFKNIRVFLAFLILGAEGYFTLVLCTFRFVISWHQHNLPGGVSWLEPRRGSNSQLTPRQRTQRIIMFVVLGPFAILFFRDNLMAAFHTVLILANTAIIIGGSFLANANLSQFDSPDTQHKLHISRILRTAGQSVFLVCNALLLVILLITARNDRRTGGRKGFLRVHPTLVVLTITWIPLIIRGVFGVLQSADFVLSYYDPNNYGEFGFTPHFTVVEYLMGVTTEWVACVLLCSTYFTSKYDPPKPEIKSHSGSVPQPEANPQHESFAQEKDGVGKKGSN
ncbi:hypothetical protein C8F04DRAFT_1034191 [Mycena alexandri]|uniref:Uncharacterized protein n=1 Tax=Mycena alexandri TaxID=1745969 RepID=A0AAD6T465_9AGAR|nr:hypothetical protein C8F04DRAFT_1034191 [Mycena alexandri]